MTKKCTLEMCVFVDNVVLKAVQQRTDKVKITRMAKVEEMIEKRKEMQVAAAVAAAAAAGIRKETQAAAAAAAAASKRKEMQTAAVRAAAAARRKEMQAAAARAAVKRNTFPASCQHHKGRRCSTMFVLKVGRTSE